jgi:hypothetical protein
MKLLRKAAKYYSKQNNRIVYVISHRFILAGYYDGMDKVKYAYNNGKRCAIPKSAKNCYKQKKKLSTIC